MSAFETYLDLEELITQFQLDGTAEPFSSPLQWRFEVEADIKTLESLTSDLFGVIAGQIDVKEHELTGEMHTFDDDSDEAVFAMVYTGTIAEESLRLIHQQLVETCAQKELGYRGVAYAAVDDDVSGDDEEQRPTHQDAIGWTNYILEQTKDWDLADLGSVAKPMRETHLQFLKDAGLEPAGWMPTADERISSKGLRSHDEIVRRLMAVMATVAWIYAPTEIISDDEITDYLRKNGVQPSDFADRETQWLAMSRSEAVQSRDQAGWMTENAWALGWLLGLAEIPTIHDDPVTAEILDPVRVDAMRDLEVGFDDLLAKTSLQSVESVIVLEDLLYCAHNALRSIALENAVAITGMGYVQERRQSLTWALSPGVSWDDTDVST